MRPLKSRFTPSFVVAVLAVSLAIGGVGFAAGTITSRDIKNETIKSIDIKDDTIEFGDLSDLAKGYAYIYNLGAQVVAQEAAVVFSNNGELSPAVSHVAGDAGITVNEGGVYEIHFSVSGTEPNQFTVFLDGVAVPETTYGSGAGTQQNNGHAVLPIDAGTVLTLMNHTSAAAVGLATPIGGTQPNVNASLLIRKLDQP